MRAKDFWTAFPLPEKLNVLRSRITRTKWTKVFFFLALIHCVIQIGLQAGAYTISSQMSAPFSKVMDMSLVTKPFAILEKNGDLTLCSDMPQRFGGSDPCTTRISFLSDGAGNKAGEDDYEDEEYEDDHDDKKLRRRFSVSPNLSSNGTVVGVTLIGLDPEQPRSRQVVSARCVATFPWIFDVLHDNAREDIVFIFYQVWLFCASLFAITYESIPHLIAALASEVLATAWSIFKIIRTESFKRDFDRIVTQGSCDGINVLPHFFNSSEPIEGVLLALNLVALVGFVMLTMKLYKMYATGMLKRVEGRLDMERHYRLILSFLSLMHLTAFFLVTVAGIFIDQLFIGRIRLVARHVMTYEIVFLFLIALTVPWLWIGLASTRKEHRIGMVVFFGISLGFMAIWGSMFGSSIYRFMFFTWSFFAVMSVSTCIMLVILIILSVLVFLNFGLGLPEYLHTPIPEHPADKVPWMIEAGNEKPELFVDSPVNTTSRTLSHKYDDSFDSKLSLATSPGQTRDFPNMESIQEPMPSIPLPATPTPVLVLSTEAVGSRRSEESEPVFPPGLGASPRGSPKGSSRRLPVPKSRWSTTTVGTEAPPTPSDVSRHSSTKKVGNASRWSTSTTATTTTNTSGLSEADIPPVPEMPQLPPVLEMPRLPQVAELVRPLPALPKKNII